jgi:hypothetical protein
VKECRAATVLEAAVSLGGRRPVEWWITPLLTAQLFVGGLPGIAAQGFLAFVVIGLALPLFGFDLRGLARGVAAADLPGALPRFVGMVRH